MTIGSVQEQTKPGEKRKKVILEKPEERLARHLRPLHIKTYMEGQPINRVLVDNGAAVNILPTNIMNKLHKDESYMISTKINVYEFSNGISQTKGIMSIELMVSNRTTLTTFLVVDTTSSYNTLLGHDWIHVNFYIPSSLHQFLILWSGDKVEVIWADSRPFVSPPLHGCQLLQ